MSVNTVHTTRSALIRLQDKDVHCHDDVFMQKREGVRGRGKREREKHASLSGSSVTGPSSTVSSGSMRASFLCV